MVAAAGPLMCGIGVFGLIVKPNAPGSNWDPAAIIHLGGLDWIKAAERRFLWRGNLSGKCDREQRSSGVRLSTLGR